MATSQSAGTSSHRLQMATWSVSHFHSVPFVFPFDLTVLFLSLESSQAVINITNYQKYRKVDAPGWKLSWTWPHKEVIWVTLGARVGDQGNCNRFKKSGFVPTTCAKSPAIFDLTADVPPSEKIDGCCKGGVLLSRLQGYRESTTAFQISVGGEGGKNTTWRVPTNYTFRTPRGEYMCSEARVVAPTRFITPDRRRVTQAFSEFPLFFHSSLLYKVFLSTYTTV